jgi:hypothetical protein
VVILNDVEKDTAYHFQKIEHQWHPRSVQHAQGIPVQLRIR